MTRASITWHLYAFVSMILLSLGIAVADMPAAAQQPTVKQMVLQQVSAEQGLKVVFTISMDGKPFKGEYMALGRRFVLDSSLLKAWYDGSDLWVYMDRSDEVNLSKPDPKELWEINPLMNLNSLDDKEFGIQTTQLSDGTYKLVAKPTNLYKGTIELITVVTDKQYKPTKITIDEKVGEQPTVVQILSIKQGTSEEMKKADFFRFGQNKLKGKRVIDLR